MSIHCSLMEWKDIPSSCSLRHMESLFFRRRLGEYTIRISDITHVERFLRKGITKYFLLLQEWFYNEASFLEYTYRIPSSDSRCICIPVHDQSVHVQHSWVERFVQFWDSFNTKSISLMANLSHISNITFNTPKVIAFSFFFFCPLF